MPTKKIDLSAERNMLGYFLLGWGIFDLIYKSLSYGFLDFQFLWFCNISLFILALGLLMDSRVLINFFLAASIVVQPVWILDLLWQLLYNVPLNGTASYVFDQQTLLPEVITTLKHLFAIPLGFFSAFRYSSPSKKSYYFIIAFGIIFLGLTGILSPENANLNCMGSPCFNVPGIDGKSPLYPYYFASAMILSVIAANFILNLSLKAYRRERNGKACKAIVYAITYLLFFASLAISAGVMAGHLGLGI